MKIRLLIFTLLFFCPTATSYSLAIAPKDAQAIGEKIWRNECAGSFEGLTSWTKGEDFPFMGIGHFIWYPERCQDPFQETFPALLLFIEKNGVALPATLKNNSRCPWKNREDFYANFESSEMKSLRQFLYETRNLQAIFMATQLENILPQLIQNLSKEEKNKVATHFYSLHSTAKGLYALIDYLNFKGSGISPKETYQGEGWGLRQVLQRMPVCSKEPLSDFVKAAKEVLSYRVEHSPPQRAEQKWLKGWMNRLDTYHGE